MLPGGTVTFLFTDIVGSTARWELDPEVMRATLAEHNDILDAIIAEHGGKTFKTVGDAYCVAFSNADMAALSARAAHRRLSELPSPVSIRIGIHTGPILPTEGDYFGPPVNKVARIQALAAGGQTLASGATKGLLGPGIAAKCLGLHRLKDLLEPTEIWQLGEGEFPEIQSVGSARNNLPIQATSFIGRRVEMEELHRLLQTTKLITLTGAGGTGKSRLATQVAADVFERFPDGAWFIELAPLLDRDGVVREVAETVGVPDGEGSLETRLTTHLIGQTVLLILDNCEHVLAEVCGLTERILSRCPSVSIVATSREPIGARGERVYAVPSLDAPAQSSETTLEELMQFGSTALFIDRLSAAAPMHRLEAAQASRIRNICARLDGIPLAIELAAARGRTMTLEEIEKRLNDRFRLLTGGSRTAVSRQQTLRAMIDWSVRLLTERQATLFNSLSVFVGGWYIDAAEQICGSEDLGIDPLDVVDLLSALVDKSLVAFDASSGRYHLLESMRHYALERLEAESWAFQHRERHARYYFAIAEATRPGAVAGEDAQTYRRFFADIENYRASVEWLLAEDSNIAALSASLLTTRHLWYWIRRMDDYLRLLQIVEAKGRDILTPKAHREARFRTGFARVLGRNDDSERIVSDMLAEYRGLDADERGLFCPDVSYLLFFQNRIQESLDLIQSELDNPATDRANLLHNMGNALGCLGRYEESIEAFEQSAALYLAEQDWFTHQSPFLAAASVMVMNGRHHEALERVLDYGRFQHEHGTVVNFTYSSLPYASLAFTSGERWFCALAHADAEGKRLTRSNLNDPFDLLLFRSIQETAAPLVDEGFLEEAKLAVRGFNWDPWLRSLLPYRAADLYGEKPFFPHPELLPPRPSSASSSQSHSSAPSSSPLA